MSMANLRWPAEWEEHERTLLAWPVRESLWQDRLENARVATANLATLISRYEPVSVVVHPKHAREAREYLPASASVILLRHDDSWIRDNSPFFLRSPAGRKAVCFEFNAWGKKYHPFHDDAVLSTHLARHFNLTQQSVPMILEGGSIHTDGAGNAIATRECLLNRNRNPDLNQAQIENILKENLNIENLIWIDYGLYGDETDGHVDNVACFVAPGVVMLQVCREADDPNYERSSANLECLRNARTSSGQRLELVCLEQPYAELSDGHLLPRSYINSVILNGAVIVPVFGGRNTYRDDHALNTYRYLFPGRRIEPFPDNVFLFGGGNLHCLTKEVPSPA